MTILIVDDSRIMRMIIRRTLRQAGIHARTVLEAGNGDEALAQVQSGRPDIILADWNMPGMTGLELLQALVAEGSEVPFGFVTSECTPQMRSKARGAGARFFIAKPFTPDVIQAALAPFV